MKAKPVAKKFQSPEFQLKIGIHSEDPKERSRAYKNNEDKTGTLGVFKSKGKLKGPK